jgi:hypothetical protein
MISWAAQISRVFGFLYIILVTLVLHQLNTEQSIKAVLEFSPSLMVGILLIIVGYLDDIREAIQNKKE